MKTRMVKTVAQNTSQPGGVWVSYKNVELNVIAFKKCWFGLVAKMEKEGKLYACEYKGKGKWQRLCDKKNRVFQIAMSL